MKQIEPINIGVDDENRKKIIAILQGTLANQHMIYIKLRNFHWNLHGPRFSPLHELFEKHYKQMEASIDDTAERIRMMGGVAPGSMKEFLDLSTLNEVEGDLIHGENAIRDLVNDREHCIRAARRAISDCQELGDEGTADMLVAQMRHHEEVAWMLRSFL